MKIPQLPWAAIVAGGGSGMAGFALMALATGAIHLGSASTCFLADHHHQAGVASACDLANRSDQTAARSCCCCPTRSGELTTTTDETPEELTPLQVTATAARAYPGCEEETGPLPGEVSLTATATIAPASTTEEEAGPGEDAMPVVASIEPTSFVGAEAAPVDPVLVVGRSPAAVRSLAMLDGLSSPTNWWSGTGTGTSTSTGGAGSGLGGGGSFGGGISTDYRTGTRLVAAEAVSPALGQDSGASSLAAELTVRPHALDSLGMVANPTSTLNIGLITLTDPLGSSRTTDATSITAGFANPPGGDASTPTPVTSASVPEPSSLLMTLVGAGLAGLATRWRWRDWSGLSA